MAPFAGTAKTYQPALPGLDLLQPAVEQLARAGSEERGAVYTRREVVEFILDLVGYTDTSPLHTRRLLEPSFGSGGFLIVAVERLLASYGRIQSHPAHPVQDLQDSIRAVELHAATFQDTRQKLSDLLLERGLSATDSETLLAHWLTQGDFLLEAPPFEFTHIVGNPPYVRQELIPDSLLAEYRRRYVTLFDRADLYIPFIENSLEQLAPQGELAFICSDRWMKNRYGAPLRELVASRFHLKCYVDMVDTPAFRDEVTAYPAITVISRQPSRTTRVAVRPEISHKALTRLARGMRGETTNPRQSIQAVQGVVHGREPWVLHAFDQLALVRRLEAEFPMLEEAGCQVGIGVATGADKVFIAPYDELDVEPDRKLPLVTTSDICSGEVKWEGLGVINPFESDGTLAGLHRHPQLAAYLRCHETAIRKRNVAQRNPRRWYRTIDRIYPELTTTPKLLIPDIKGEPHIVYEQGRLYPHHNLYYIVSSEWDLLALQALLMSGIARLFVSTYSTRMRGGYLRYQAQYLRRIRIPTWEVVPPRLRRELKHAAQQGTASACNEAVSDLYQLPREERALLRANL